MIWGPTVWGLTMQALWLDEKDQHLSFAFMHVVPSGVKKNQ